MKRDGADLTPAGKGVFGRVLPDSELRLRELFAKLRAKRGAAPVVVERSASIGAPSPAVARDAGCRVAYLPGG
ncbi:hypothetical protein GCM10010207_57100 [Streptomyces atratus]|nr:hypothetical protein GCM10010207_57100 [Streptomyces atratus]